MTTIVILAESPLFDLGEVYITPGAKDVLDKLGIDPASLIVRHVSGDWSELPVEDQESNKIAVEQENDRVFSSYKLSSDNTKIWVITEWDRSVTTILLPEEY